MKEEEILKKLSTVDLGLFHKGYALQEGIAAENIMLAEETKDSMMAKELAQSVVVGEYPNEKASVLIEVLMSKEMEKFMETNYQGSLSMMDGMVSGIKATTKNVAEASVQEDDVTEEPKG